MEELTLKTRLKHHGDGSISVYVKPIEGYYEEMLAETFGGVDALVKADSLAKDYERYPQMWWELCLRKS